jgi:uncharacterized Zn finger protein (UPF0148 family)
MQIFCKKCNTPAYDDSSFFCYKCGMQLPVHIREKKKDLSKTIGIKVLFKESMNVRDDSPSLLKPAPVQPVKQGPMNNALPQTQSASAQTAKPHSAFIPDDFHGTTKLSAPHPANLIETCAQCGGPIVDKNRIFCSTCGKYVREEPSRDESSIVDFPDQGFLVKSPVIYHNQQIEKIKEPGVALSEELHILPNSKNKLWLIAIIVAIALLFFIYMLMLLMIYLAESNNPFPMLK